MNFNLKTTVIFLFCLMLSHKGEAKVPTGSCLKKINRSSHLRHLIHPKSKVVTRALREVINESDNGARTNLNILVDWVSELSSQSIPREEMVELVSRKLRDWNFSGELCNGSLVDIRRFKLFKLDALIPTGREVTQALVSSINQPLGTVLEFE